MWANSGKFGTFQENSGEFSGIQYGAYFEFWGISGRRRDFGKFGLWGGFG